MIAGTTDVRAAVLRGRGAPGGEPPFDLLRVEELSLDPPGPGEVLVDVAAASICHSDLSVLTGHRPRPLPMVLGHEASGVVAAVGPEVTDVRLADHVVMSYVPACGHCRYCAAGRPALCEPGSLANGEGRLLTGSRPFRDLAGERLNAHLGLSAFATRTVVAQESLVVVPPSMPLDAAALLGCAVLTGTGAVMNTARVPRGASVAVFGVGGVGLSVVLGATLAEAEVIVAVDTTPEKLALAQSVGATDGVISRANAATEVQRTTGGGADFAFDTTGVPGVLEAAYAATRRGGTVVVLGLSEPSARVQISPADLVASERSILGSYMGSSVPRRDIPRLAELHAAGRLPLARLIGERMPLDDVPDGFRSLHEGVLGRQLIEVGLP